MSATGPKRTFQGAAHALDTPRFVALMSWSALKRVHRRPNVNTSLSFEIRLLVQKTRAEGKSLFTPGMRAPTFQGTVWGREKVGAGLPMGLRAAPILQNSK